MTAEFFLKQIKITEDFLRRNPNKSSFTGKGISAFIQLNKDLKRTKLKPDEKTKVYTELNRLKEFIFKSMENFKEI